MDPILCTLFDKKSLKPGQPHFQFEHMDSSPLSDNELVDIGQNPWGHKYPASKTNFLWKLENYTPDIKSQYWQRRCFAVMFRSIGFIIPRRYRSVRQNTDKADFNIGFVKDIEVFGGRRGVLAHAVLFHPNNPPGSNGMMEWNDSPESNWMFTPFGDALPAWMIDNVHYTEGEVDLNGNIKMLESQPMLSIGMHELKHNHGYRHNLLDPTSMLFPYVKDGYNKTYDIGNRTWIRTINPEAFIWTDSDIQRWEEGYGRRRFSWLSRFRARRLRGRFIPGIPYRVAT